MIQKVKLGTVAKYSDTRTNLSNLTTDNYIGTDNLLQNKQGKKKSEYLVDSGVVTEYLEGDILISNIRPYLKKIWYATNSGGNSPDVLTIRLNNDNFNSKFVYYNLFQDAFFDYAMNGSKGSKMPRGDKNQIMDFEIPKLPLITQRSIADILSVLDNKIEINKKINCTLTNLARIIYDYTFVQGEKSEWETVNLIDSPIHKVVKAGLTEFDGEKIYYDTKQIDENGISGFGALVTNESRASRANMQPVKRSVWFAKMKDTVKHVILTDMDAEILNSIFSTGMFGIEVDELAFEYLACFIKFSDFENRKNDLAHGATQQAVNNQDIEQISFKLPGTSTLITFHNKVSPIFQKIQTNSQESAKLAKLRDFLLPQLMSGRIKVKE